MDNRGKLLNVKLLNVKDFQQFLNDCGDSKNELNFYFSLGIIVLGLSIVKSHMNQPEIEPATSQLKSGT